MNKTMGLFEKKFLNKLTIITCWLSQVQIEVHPLFLFLIKFFSDIAVVRYSC